MKWHLLTVIAASAGLVVACTQASPLAGSPFASAGSPDADGDGTIDDDDCAPLDDAVHPDAPETCNGLDDNCDGRIDEPVDRTYCVPVIPPRDLSAVCDGRRMVGVLSSPAATCPDADPDWSGGDLFASLRSADGTRFCVYDYVGTGEPEGTSGLPDDAGRSAEDWLEPDCAVVSPQTPTPAEQALDVVYPTYANAFRTQLEVQDPLPSFGGGAITYPVPVHVAVVDSAPPVAPSGGTPPIRVGGENALSLHARVMGRVIEEIACPHRVGGPGPCATEFSHHLALDRVSPDAQHQPSGGTHGYISTLAAQIEDAVLEFHARASADNLVINLSVGFEPQYASGAWGQRTAVQALEAALDDAACQGALTFAAVGNAEGGELVAPQVGPVYPAGFAPQASSCGSPLVHPVGGVDARDEPIAATRVGGRAGLVAPARLATVDLALLDAQQDASSLMTGTSFGAAAASGIAALLWGYLPSLPAETISTLMANESSVELPGLLPADVCNAPLGCDRPRRLSACAAVQTALEQRCTLDPASAACTLAPSLSCLTRRISAHSGVAVTAPPNSFHLEPGPSAINLTVVVDSPSCPMPIHADQTFLPDHPDLCPSSQYVGPTFDPDVVRGQPVPNPCHFCGWFVDGLYIALDPNTPVIIMGVTLIVNGNTSWDLTSAFSASGGLIQAGQTAYISDLRQPPIVNQAELQFTVGDGFGGVSHISVDIPVY